MRDGIGIGNLGRFFGRFTCGIIFFFSFFMFFHLDSSAIGRETIAWVNIFSSTDDDADMFWPNGHHDVGRKYIYHV